MTDSVGPRGALAGLKVVDLARVLGGPYCTMILADHGADVIKVEPPQGDETRDWGPPFDAAHDASYFQGVNRNKRGLALDISKPAGRAVVLRLLEGADVLVENFKTGSMERWGLGYATLEPLFPGLIHCRVSGFGAEGPLGGLPGYDAIVQAMVGLMSINGNPADGPLRIGTPVVDMTTGLYSTVAILMALFERARSGRGQFLDMTLHDCGMALLHPSGANYLESGRRPLAWATRTPTSRRTSRSAPRRAPCSWASAMTASSASSRRASASRVWRRTRASPATPPASATARHWRRSCPGPSPRRTATR